MSPIRRDWCSVKMKDQQKIGYKNIDPNRKDKKIFNQRIIEIIINHLGYKKKTKKWTQKEILMLQFQLSAEVCFVTKKSTYDVESFFFFFFYTWGWKKKLLWSLLKNIYKICSKNNFSFSFIIKFFHSVFFPKFYKKK